MEPTQRTGRRTAAPRGPQPVTRTLNWRRVAEALKLRDAVRLMDERDQHAEQLDESNVQVAELAEEIEEQGEAVADMARQSKLGSYSRISIGGKR
jgi:hypothetical protein